MRLPLSWLRAYCDPPLTGEEVAERLDLTGTELERIERHGVAELGRFVVGRVISAERHPDADRLTVCRVDVGAGEPAQIVCGAPNVAAGQTVAVARPGAVLPDGTRLGAAELRGVRSEGMILAEDELAISADHHEIIVLEQDGLRPGDPLGEALPIATEVLELEITPNRPDCLAVYGLAREVHAATGAPLAPPPWAHDPGSPGEIEGVSVTVEDPDLCPRFTARVFDDVAIGPSPPWLKARLTAAGQRPISNVVDVTNYVMLLTGQPLHAYDLERIPEQWLIVRRAEPGERLVTLDDVERSFDERMVLVCDPTGPNGIGGVMGGARSEVSAGTTRVLMEAATWDGPNIQRTSTRLGLRTEASGRFEKQLSPEQALEGQVMATILMQEVCGARLVPGTIDVGGPGGEPEAVRLRAARLSSLLGIEIPIARATEILRALGFETEEAPGGLTVRVPHWRRTDVRREADLIEEVARIDGVDRLPATLPSRRDAYGLLTEDQRARRRAADLLAGRGLHEMVGWSFADPGLVDRLRLEPGDPRRRVVALANPMAADQSVLRTTLLGSLLDGARHNVARGQSRVALFETGGVYRADGEGPLPVERTHLGAVLAGPALPPTWRGPAAPAADFFAAKGVLEGLLDGLRVPFAVARAGQPFLHPGRAAAVEVGGAPIGWVGEVHPAVAAGWALEGAAAFELDLDAVIAHVPAELRYRDLTSFPPVLRDLSLSVPADVPADRVVATIAAAAGDLLAGAEVFDVYRGAQAGEGRVSLALHLAFQAPDRTLTDEEAGELVERVLARLGEELEVTPRA